MNPRAMLAATYGASAIAILVAISIAALKGGGERPTLPRDEGEVPEMLVYGPELPEHLKLQPVLTALESREEEAAPSAAAWWLEHLQLRIDGWFEQTFAEKADTARTFLSRFADAIQPMLQALLEFLRLAVSGGLGFPDPAVDNDAPASTEEFDGPDSEGPQPDCGCAPGIGLLPF